MDNLRRRFSSWYYRKGYRAVYRPESVELLFACPIWIRPLVFIFFSPCTYYREAAYDLSDGLTAGLKG